MAHTPACRPWPVLVASAALLLGAPALAQNQAQDQVPDMRGRWKVETLTIVVGAGAHHPLTGGQPFDPGKPRLHDFVGTLQIDGQQGPRFWGTLESPAYKEGVIGVFSGEDRRFIMVDSDGFHQGQVVAPGRIRYCYMQNDLALKVAGCGTMTHE